MSSGLMSSLSFRQAVRGMSMALILGLALTVVEMAWSVSRERDKAIRLAGEIMELLDGAATVAVWTFDKDLGNRVAQDSLTLKAVQRFTLYYENGDVLASSQRGTETESLLGMTVFADLVVTERELFRPAEYQSVVPEDDGRQPIGIMRVQLDPAVISADLSANLVTSLIGGIVRNLLLGLALTLVFHRFLTQPLVALGREIDLIDPARPEHSAVAIPPGHATDELGSIAARVNLMLRRLTTVQGDLRRLSTRDPLTRLPNRALYDEGMATAIVRARRSGHEMAVMVVQMRPDAVTRGGDRAIQHVAMRLRDCVRGADLVARLGTGEFAAVLPESDAPRAMRIADRVISGLAHGLSVGESRIDNTPCIGIALYPSEGTDAEALTTLARAAAVRAAATNTQVQFATEGLTDVAHDYLNRSDALLSALEMDQVALTFQPVMDIAAGKPRGLVAIPSWRQKDIALEGLELVRFAREIGLDVSLLDRVLRNAVKAATTRGVPWPLIVRCGDRQLSDPAFVDLVLRLRRESNLPENSLALLVPQSFSDLPEILPVLRGLRAASVMLWLDVSRPEDLEIRALTERLFDGIEVVAPSGEVPAAMTAVLGLATDLGMALTVRGVSTQAQWATMARAGCKRLRGPVVAAAVPMDRLADMLTDLQETAGSTGAGRGEQGPTA